MVGDETRPLDFLGAVLCRNSMANIETKVQQWKEYETLRDECVQWLHDTNAVVHSIDLKATCDEKKQQSDTLKVKLSWWAIRSLRIRSIQFGIFGTEIARRNSSQRDGNRFADGTFAVFVQKSDRAAIVFGHRSRAEVPSAVDAGQSKCVWRFEWVVTELILCETELGDENRKQNCLCRI